MQWILAAQLLFVLGLPVQAEIDPKIRKACLPAADFEGCVRAYTQPKAISYLFIPFVSLFSYANGFDSIINHLKLYF